MKAPDINVSRWQLACRWMFGLGGHFSPELNDQLQAVAVLENDRFEQRIARGELTFSGVSSQALLAANFSQVGLFIPPGAGVLVTIEGIFALQTNAIFNLRRQYAAGPFATGGSAIGVDTRMGTTTTPAAQLVATVNAAALGTQFHIQPARGAGVSGSYEREIAMAASATTGVVIWYDLAVVNLAVDATFRWRERPLESGFFS